MVKKLKMKNRAKGKANAPKSKPKNKKKGKSKSNGLPKPVKDYMSLINDPCKGPLVRSIGSDMGAGIIERTRGTTTLPGTLGLTNGYVAWFPGFHCAGATGAVFDYKPSNLYYWNHNTTGSRPNNTVADPMGTTINSSGRFVIDPSSNLISSTSAFSRAKATSACIQCYSTTSVSSLKGQVALVMRMSLANFDMNSGVPGSVFQPPSVAELLAYASTRERLNLDGHELKWAPTERDCQLRTSGAEKSGSELVPNTEPDAAFWYGKPGVTPTVVATPDPNNVFGIILVWSNVTDELNHMNFACTKTVELELAPRSSAIEEIPGASGRPMKSIPGFENVNDVVNTMDTADPSWRVTAAHVAGSLASKVINAALTGGPMLAMI